MTSFIFFFIFIPLLSIILLSVNFILAPHKPYKEKKTPFECGYHSFLAQNRTPFNISFLVFGLLFLVFDLEIVLIYPYTVSSITNSTFGLVVMIGFAVIVTIGFIYEIGKGALKIYSKQDEFFISIGPIKDKFLLANKNLNSGINNKYKEFILFFFIGFIYFRLPLAHLTGGMYLVVNCIALYLVANIMYLIKATYKGEKFETSIFISIFIYSFIFSIFKLWIMGDPETGLETLDYLYISNTTDVQNLIYIDSSIIETFQYGLDLDMSSLFVKLLDFFFYVSNFGLLTMGKEEIVNKVANNPNTHTLYMEGNTNQSGNHSDRNQPREGDSGSRTNPIAVDQDESQNPSSPNNTYLARINREGADMWRGKESQLTNKLRWRPLSGRVPGTNTRDWGIPDNYKDPQNATNMNVVCDVLEYHSLVLGKVRVLVEYIGPDAYNNFCARVDNIAEAKEQSGQRWQPYAMRSGVVTQTVRISRDVLNEVRGDYYREFNNFTGNTQHNNPQSNNPTSSSYTNNNDG